MIILARWAGRRRDPAGEDLRYKPDVMRAPSSRIDAAAAAGVGTS
jgi:epoxyqueuosine reductase QueG